MPVWDTRKGQGSFFPSDFDSDGFDPPIHRRDSFGLRSEFPSDPDGSGVRVPLPPLRCQNHNVLPSRWGYLASICQPRQRVMFEPQSPVGSVVVVVDDVVGQDVLRGAGPMAQLHHSSPIYETPTQITRMTFSAPTGRGRRAPRAASLAELVVPSQSTRRVNGPFSARGRHRGAPGSARPPGQCPHRLFAPLVWRGRCRRSRSHGPTPLGESVRNRKQLSAKRRAFRAALRSVR